ncbi:hypothetical protein [Epilithonimonas lactis]|nr:hypothetical protein [Epilithonimonas lactis]SEQ52619.1 hypothetical protein SAMN04488097_2363 [Epilithonimonas lactis]
MNITDYQKQFTEDEAASWDVINAESMKVYFDTFCAKSQNLQN